MLRYCISWKLNYFTRKTFNMFWFLMWKECMYLILVTKNFKSLFKKLLVNENLPYFGKNKSLTPTNTIPRFYKVESNEIKSTILDKITDWVESHRTERCHFERRCPVSCLCYILDQSMPGSDINPVWHGITKQEKCSTLELPRGNFCKTQWAGQGVKITQLISIFTSKKVWKFLKKNELTKSDLINSTGQG